VIRAGRNLVESPGICPRRIVHQPLAVMNENQIAALNELVGQCRRLELEFDLEISEVLAVTQALPFLLMMGAQGFVKTLNQFEQFGPPDADDSAA